MAKSKKHWTNHIKDNDLVRNVIILVVLGFVLLGLLIMYIRKDLQFEHFQTSLDIAIGIVIGSGLLKLLNKNGDKENER